MLKLLKLLAVAGCVTVSLYGQNASLSGIVADSTRAVVPHATVQVASTATGLKFATTTNDTGLYSFHSLKPGVYDVTVSASGFKTEIRHALKLDVLQQANLDFVLTVGQANESVTVSASGELMQTTDSSVSTVINSHFVENIPLNGRSFNTLVELTPGTVVVATNESSRGQYSMNGQRADANYYTVDGVSANVGVSSSKGLAQGGGGGTVGASALGGTNSLVSLDALQEFRVLTSTYAPEYGRTAGGQIVVVTRSGTNKFHGTAFDYFRNDKLDANDWFADQAGLPKAASRQNDFGGTIGGPIFKNRTFFFFSYEGLRLRQPTFSATDVPSLALRKSAPASLQPLLNAFPQPTGADEVDPKTGKLNGLAPADSTITNPSTLDAVSLKLDHAISSKLQAFARYDYAPSHADTRSNGNIAGALNSVTRFNAPLQTFTVGAVAVLSPTLTNDLRFNYSRGEGAREFFIDNFAGGSPLASSILFPSGFNAANSLASMRILSGAQTSIAQGPLAHVVNKQYNVVDSVATVKGSHQLKFGVDYRRISTAALDNALQYSLSWTDTGTLGATPGTILSGVGNNTVSISRPGTLFFNTTSLYGQDVWTVRPGLTLTYGLRWEFDPPPGSDPVPLFAVNQVSDPSTMALAPPGTPLYHTSYTDFAPRVGIAYQVNQSANWMTVLRGGFGLFYDTGYGSLSSLTAFQPFVAVSSLKNVPFPLPANQQLSQLTSTPPLSGLQAVDPNLTLPKTWQWNVAVEQELGANQSLTLSYVGAAGRDLYIQDQYINVNPSFLALTTIGTNDSTSDYNSLQVQYQHKFEHGLQALANYTWAHSIDTASSDTSTEIHPANFTPDSNRGNSDFDVRHDFTLAAVYQIPTPQFAGGAGRTVLGGWLIDPVVRLRSSLPIDITSTRAVSGNTITSRVNVVPGQPYYIYDPTVPGGRRFNPLAFSAPTGFVQGTFGRNVIRGFGFGQLDLSLHRVFKIREPLTLEFRSDFFNILNHPNFGNPRGAYSTSSTFGVATQMLGDSLNSASGGGFNALYQIGSPRSIQLSLRLRF